MFTGKDQTKYWLQKTCHICEGGFIQGDRERKVIKMSEYWKEDLAKSILLLRKSVMC